MKNSSVTEYWCIFATKVSIRNDKLVIGRFFGLNETQIPIEKINLVGKNLIWETTVSTVGGEDYKITPWSMESRKTFYNKLQKIIVEK